MYIGSKTVDNIGLPQAADDRENWSLSLWQAREPAYNGSLGHVSMQVVKQVKSIKQCDSGLGEELAEIRELYRREALQRKLLYNQVTSSAHCVLSRTVL